MANERIVWSSAGIHTDTGICVDVKATPVGVTLGQIHGEHNSYAADLHLSCVAADAIARALLEASEHAREAGA